jgi:hypothetical protein
MDTWFKCDYCCDYIFSGDDFIKCDCGLRWCSTRCARLHGYLNKKTSSTCDFCRGDSPGSLINYLLLLAQKGELISHTYE